MTNPTVSVVIVSWNQLSFLKNCLDSLHLQIYKPIKIIVVDNASSDGSPEWVETNYPEINLKRLPQNRGFSAAFNEGVRLSEGLFVLSINPDVVIHSDCLVHMVKILVDNPKVGIVAPKLLQQDNIQKLDSTGLFINRFRRPYDRGQGEVDNGQYDQDKQIFGACGALALFRKEMLNDLAYENEFLDEDFFAYYEDADLAWRAQRCGWQALFEPYSIGTHVRGWGDTIKKQRKKNTFGPRLALRNRYLMILKNDDLPNFLKDFPLILSVELPKLLYTAIYMPSVLLGVVDFFILSRKILRKRRALWQKGSVKEAEINRWFVKP